MAYLIAKAGAGIARGELLGRIFVLRGGGGRHVTRRGTPWARWAPVGPGGPRWALWHLWRVILGRFFWGEKLVFYQEI